MARKRRPDVLLLGPLSVLEDGHEIELGGRMQRTLLAILLVHRGAVVSVDRLVDELWGSAPPAGAAKTLQVYVSRLRGALGGTSITHEAGGYVLRLPADAVDVDRFERLYAEGRELRGRGDSRAAAETLRAALALWRGPPLGGLGDGALSAEIARLEELHHAAVEERVEADLELGRHTAVVPELERLVREQPSRERLRGQLMIALYRSGRQTDALEVYRDGRSALRDELGLEPGPELQELERAILNQELDLHAPLRAGVVGAQRRGALLAVAGGLVLVAAALAAVAIAHERTTSPGFAPGASDSLVEIDPATNTLISKLPIGAAPVAVALGAGSVWVANAGDQTLTRVDPVTRQILGRTGLGRIPSEVSFGQGALWVASAIGLRGVVQAVDPASASIASSWTIRIGAGVGDDVFAPPTPNTVVSGAGRIWANNLHSGLSRFLPGRGVVVTQTLGSPHSVDGIAVGEGAVWVASGADDRVLRLDPRGQTVVAEIPIAAAPGARLASPYGVTVGYGSVWVTDALSNTVSEIDPKLNTVTATIRVGTRPTRIAAGEHAVWVVNAGDGTVTRIDPHRHAAVATIRVGRAITSIAAGLGGVWATTAGGTPIESSNHGLVPVRSLPSSSCAPVVHGTGTPDVLIASELPTFVGTEAPDPVVADMRAAILDILRRRGFRAGHYQLGYQACDYSTPENGPAPERCAANARAFSLDGSLLGVIGTHNSSCAQVELPILNAAPAGPVPLVSPTNTYVGLTHAGPATAADEPDRYRPTGSLNYLHLRGSDDDQSAAIALFLKQRGRTRVALLDDGEGTGFAGATYFSRAAQRLGLRIVARDTWETFALDYKVLAGRIKRLNADAVVLSGCVCANGRQLVADLRAALGRYPTIVGTDNFTESGDEFPVQFGPLGLRVAVAGRDTEMLPSAGRKLLSEVAAQGGSQNADPSAVYAAEATSLLIDAIAHSKGTRASVNRALFRTRLRSSLIGSIAFSPNGDPLHAPVTIYRVDPADLHRNHRSPEGLVAEALYVPDGLAR